MGIGIDETLLIALVWSQVFTKDQWITIACAITVFHRLTLLLSIFVYMTNVNCYSPTIHVAYGRVAWQISIGQPLWEVSLVPVDNAPASDARVSGPTVVFASGWINRVTGIATDRYHIIIWHLHIYLWKPFGEIYMKHYSVMRWRVYLIYLMLGERKVYIILYHCRNYRSGGGE